MHDDRQWVSIAEAARRLRCSEVTVRRRIKQGALEGELQQGRRGPEYRVRLPSGVTVSMVEPTHDDAHEHDRDDDQGAAEATHLAAELIRLLDEQRAEMAMVRTELAAARGDLLAEARVATEWRTRAELLDRQVAELRAELEHARRPWWRRLFRD